MMRRVAYFSLPIVLSILANAESGPTDTAVDPILTITPSEYNTVENFWAIFKCGFEGIDDGHTKIQWTRDGNNISSSRSFINGSYLEIPNVRLHDAGTYICHATRHNRSTNATAVLQIKPRGQDIPPPDFCPCEKQWTPCRYGSCIHTEWECDMQPDCVNGTDEEFHRCFKCLPYERACPTGECINSTQICDGIHNDCPDDDDERHCNDQRRCDSTRLSCESDEFRCDCGQCIKETAVCDGKPDCADSSDESKCYVDNGSDKMDCAQILKCSEDERTLSGGDHRCKHLGKCMQECLNYGGFITEVLDRENIRSKQCVSCFCSGRSTKCQRAKMYKSQISLSDKGKILSVDVTKNIPLIKGELHEDITIRESDRAEITMSVYDIQDIRYHVPYLQLPKACHGNQLNSWGQNLKYTLQYSSDEIDNGAPAAILRGNEHTLTYKPKANEFNNTPLSPSGSRFSSPRHVAFTDGDWYIYDKETERPAIRQEIMMVLTNVTDFLIKMWYSESTRAGCAINGIVMDTATSSGTGEQVFSIEECDCPPGYTGNSCQSCAYGYHTLDDGQCLPDNTPSPLPVADQSKECNLKDGQSIINKNKVDRCISTCISENTIPTYSNIKV